MKKNVPVDRPDTRATAHATARASARASEKPRTDGSQELLRQAQSGSLDAYATLRGQYSPLIRSSVARCDRSELSMQERSDLCEEAERIFLNAVSSFDTAQDEVSFGLYAKICLHNGLVSEMRHITARRRLEVVPMPEEVLSDGEDPAEVVEAEERFSGLCAVVRSCLSDFENLIWWQYVSGVSASEIASRLGRDEKSIHNAIYRIRRKLRERLTAETGE